MIKSIPLNCFLPWAAWRVSLLAQDPFTLPKHMSFCWIRVCQYSALNTDLWTFVFRCFLFVYLFCLVCFLVVFCWFFLGGEGHVVAGFTSTDDFLMSSLCCPLLYYVYILKDTIQLFLKTVQSTIIFQLIKSIWFASLLKCYAI